MKVQTHHPILLTPTRHKMPLITHPKTYRTLQLTLSILSLILLSYSSTHIGYWTNTTLAIALGSKFPSPPSLSPTPSHSPTPPKRKNPTTNSLPPPPFFPRSSSTVSTSLLTTLHLTHHLYALHRTHTTTTTLVAPSKSQLVAIATVAAEMALLLLWAGATACMLRPKGKDFRVLFDEPPRVVWGVAVAVAGVEM